MIKYFDSFYGGHVEMGNLGFQGLPVDERIESDEHLATACSEAHSFAQIMEPAGYDTLWLAEHHFQREGYGGIPNIPMLAVFLTQATERLNYGCMFNIVPAWHPLRLAEDYAMADILTNGRFRLGIGRGYIAREVETLGSPLNDDHANRERFEEQVDIIFKALNQSSFSHRGKYYELPARVLHRREQELKDITLVPRPVKRPVECWQPIVSASPRGIDFMIKHSIKGVLPGGSRAVETARKWQQRMARSGHETELGDGLAMVLQIHLADTQDAAIAEASIWVEEQFKALAPLGRMPNLTKKQIDATYDPKKASHAGLPTAADLDRDGGWICGPPDHVFQRICEIQEQLPGLERITVQAGALGVNPSTIRQDLEWFGSEVLPKFQVD